MTAHTAVDYKIIFKNAKIVFDARNTPKNKNDNIEKLLCVGNIFI